MYTIYVSDFLTSKKFLALLFIIILVFLYFIFQNKVGDIIPAVIPSTTQIESTPGTTTVETNGATASITNEITNYTLPKGFKMGQFAKDLGQARDMTFTPQGTLLVSIPGSGTVIALPDTNNDGQADEKTTVISNLNQPHGIAFYNNKLFIAEVNRVARYTFDPNTHTATLDKVLFSLPQNTNHNKRTLVFDKNGNLYVSVASTCNVCIEQDPRSGSVLITNENGDNPRIFASGTRNAAFLAINPFTNQVWVTEMGRDNLGDNLPPDEINILEDNKNYGWPYCYGNKIYDSNFGRGNPSDCTNTIAPIFEIPAHSAPLGITFIPSGQFPDEYVGDILISYHGSWNRSVPDGYKVVRMNVEGNSISNADDFISGFITGNNAIGRPVEVLFDNQGSLYVSDDKAGMIYKVIYDPQN